MGFLDNSSVTVDAVLTKKGREILKNGGNLNITSFTMSDTGVDYTLWNTDHPSGSAFYGEAIENLPMLEASVHAEYNLRNRLITLNQEASALPTIILSGLDVAGGNVLTLNDGDESSAQVGIELIGYAAATTNYSMVIQDPSVVSTNATAQSSLSGTSQMFLAEQDIPHAQEYSFTGNQVTLQAVQQRTSARETNVYIFDMVTGAYNSFRVINNVLRSTRALISKGGQN
tara:strand:- start:2951 stop:3637 length:687 start_codon:yes stop_codon:yes gene_type:complete